MVQNGQAAFDLAVVEKMGRADLYWRAHRRARFIWERTSNWLLAAIAVLGGLSGGSAIASLSAAVVVLGLLTAACSGLNAGLHPAEKAAQHRVSSAAYGKAFRSLELLLCDRAAGVRSWDELRPLLVEIDDALNGADAEAPSVRPRKEERGDSVRRVTFLLTGEAKGHDTGSSTPW